MHGTSTGVFKNQIDWIPLSVGAVRPTQGWTLTGMQVSGGSQSFHVVNAMRVLGRSYRKARRARPMDALLRLTSAPASPLDAAVRIHAALADGSRLRIVALLLAYEELCVCDVEAILDLTQSRASRQLKALREARLVTDRRAGTWAYYRIHDEALPLLGPLGVSLRGDPLVREDLRRARAYRRPSGCDARARPVRRRKDRG